MDFTMRLTTRFKVILFASLSALTPQLDLSAEQGVVALRGATVETMTKQGRIENATIVLQDGKIVAVGKKVTVPDTAKEIDISGKTVMPGIIDPYHVVRIDTGNNQPATRTISFRGRTFTVPVNRTANVGSFVKIADSFYPYDSAFRPLMRSGVTQTNLVTSGYGQSATAKITPDDPESMIYDPDGLIYLSVSNNSTTLNVLRSGLSGSSGSSARASSQRRGSSGGSRTTGSTRRPTTSASSTATRALWQKVVKGESPVIINVNNSAAILHLMKALKEYEKVKVVLVTTGATLYPALDSLKNRNVSLILRPTIDLVPNTQDRINIPRLVHEAGIDFAFSLSVSQSDLNASQDAPLFRIAYLVKAGLDRDTALTALTTRPAKILGLEKTHGTIEPGKSADLLVFNGDPLDPTSQLSHVMVQGGIVYED